MNMKTAGVLTFHRAWNYGACLQTWATIKVLEQLGYDAEIIDYINETEQGIKKHQNNFISGIKRTIVDLIKNCILKKKKCIARSFEQGNGLYDLNTKDYIIDWTTLSYDLLVAGSDQIWNPEITGGLDPAFFLAYGNADKRISLASSIGSHCFSDEEKRELAKHLKRFNAISVRGEHARNQTQQLVEHPVMRIPDPTLLLDRLTWHRLIKGGDKKKTPYVLTYFVGKNYGKYRKMIRPYIREAGLPVYNIQFNTMQYPGTKSVIGATPVDFLGLIRDAEMIITDSFHGTVFSIVFGKPFLVMENKANPKRVREFLKDIKLENRIEPSVERMFEVIEYDKVYEVMDCSRRDAIAWLREMIESGN